MSGKEDGWAAPTEHQLALLRMYKPSTYGIALGAEGKELERMGLVEWMPPKYGVTMYAITDAGRAAVRATRTPGEE